MPDDLPRNGVVARWLQDSTVAIKAHEDGTKSLLTKLPRSTGANALQSSPPLDELMSVQGPEENQAGE